MTYFFIALLSVVFSVLSLPYVKIYQLKGYKINSYFNNIYSLEMFFRGKTPLKFTKRIIRLLLCLIIFEFLLCWIVLVYIKV